MKNQGVLLVLLMLGIPSSFVFGNSPTSEGCQSCQTNNPTPERIGEPEAFDNEFEETFENAVKQGFIRGTLDLHKPSRVEVALRKTIAYLFMKYLALKKQISTSSVQFKALYQKCWAKISSPLAS